ncbi:MAG TPA: hypothetical protein VNR87_13410 [Flavisolibacter sp.]|nr:hypothetical protein [Flavisolibacter sp.]
MKKIFIGILLTISLSIVTTAHSQNKRNTRRRASDTVQSLPDSGVIKKLANPGQITILRFAIPELKAEQCPEVGKLLPSESKSISARGNLEDKHDLQLIIGLPHGDAIGGEQKYVLTNIQNKHPFKGTMSGVTGDSIVFNIPWDELSDADIRQLHLTSADQKVCYSFLLELKIKEARPVPTVKVPSIDLSGLPVVAADPCTSCSPEGHIITYNFSNNSLKNKKVGGKTWHEEDYLVSRWTKLPWVGHEMTFNVINVNPFKYDITVSDSLVSLNVEAPDALVKAFTLGNIPSAAGLVGDENNTRDLFLGMMQNIGELISTMISEFQNAGDCYNPCDKISAVVTKINKYFVDNFGYKTDMPLETFLLKNINELFDAEKDKEKIAELKSIVAKFRSFRSMAFGNYSYRIPQIHNVDQYIFKLSILPKDGISAGARVANQQIAVDVLGGFKVDVSSGLFATDLVDHKYILRPDSSVVRTANGFGDSIVYNRRNRVLRETAHSRDFGVASFFHFYPKLTPNINFATSLGAALSISDKPKLRYLVGFSFLGGKANRLALTYGWSAGYVERLSNRYEPDGTGGIFTLSTDKEISMKKVFKVRHFVALTFSIPLINKKESAAADAAPPDAKKDDKSKAKESTKPDQSTSDSSAGDDQKEVKNKKKS